MIEGKKEGEGGEKPKRGRESNKSEIQMEWSHPHEKELQYKRS